MNYNKDFFVSKTFTSVATVSYRGVSFSLSHSNFVHCLVSVIGLDRARFWSASKLSTVVGAKAILKIVWHPSFLPEGVFTIRPVFPADDAEMPSLSWNDPAVPIGGIRLEPELFISGGIRPEPGLFMFGGIRPEPGLFIFGGIRPELEIFLFWGICPEFGIFRFGGRISPGPQVLPFLFGFGGI